jgi:predicted dehydrogenase
MYLPALAGHTQARVTAICGRTRATAEGMAERWGIPRAYTAYDEMLAAGNVDAVIVATPNDSHYALTMRALHAGLHVLCEKPLALTYARAREMAQLADRQGVKHMVPFTYRYMPGTRYLKELVDEGYIGRPYHLNLRYYTGYGRSGSSYLWRFDKGRAGAGAVADIGSHFLYLARWFFGEITSITCHLGRMVERAPRDPQGNAYEQADDTAMMMVIFADGAQGSIHVSTVASEETSFGQTHHMELHGSQGTLHSMTDWDTVHRVTGARRGEGAVRELPIPARLWAGARRDTVHNTYRDVFRTQNVMAREFVTAIAEDQDRPLEPSFHDGAAIQRLVEAAVRSDGERCRVEVESIH